MSLTSLWSHVENQLLCFPQTTGPTPSPNLLSFQPHMHTHVTQLLLWEEDIGMWEPFPSDTITN